MIRRNKTNKKKSIKKLIKMKEAERNERKRKKGSLQKTKNGGKRKKNLGKKRMKEYIKLAVIFGV